jgi:hypothetical protein
MGKNQNSQAFDVTDEYYKELDDAAVTLAEAEYQLSLLTDGVDIVEKTLMYKADLDFKEQTGSGKTLAVDLQRREAKRSQEYANVVRAKAAAKRAQSLARSRRADMEMKFDEWRTRSADRRKNNSY